MANFVQNSLGLTPPRFHLGEAIASEWIDEEGATHRDRGVIVGVFLAPPGFAPGWWYVVNLSHAAGCPWLTIPHREELHESDLQLDEVNQMEQR